MSSFEKDYKKLYHLQDKFLLWWQNIQWLEKVNWLRSPVNLSSFEKHIKQVADDFLLGKDNSLGINTTPIEQALPK